ncbi:MAG TPA: cytidylate kinase family protein [Candidatus Saccharimonadales bacterium]|nr:cytidylate kinase family protein [Candidatus Saccharimonadales bacterium]
MEQHIVSEETQKKHIITIAGRPGSGKSTTAKVLAARLGLRHFSSGSLFRQIAKEQGIDLMQANLSAEQNSAVDHAVDGRLREINELEDNLVIDSRTAWHWMPASFKVFLDLDMKIAAERILADMDAERRASENITADPVAYAGVLQERLDSENRRYKALYGIDPYNLANYDLVIDTATNNVEKVVEEILEKFTIWLQQKS